MSNTIINSNSNSALISTLTESEEAIVNPFTYAEKNIVPPHSVQIVSVPPLNTGNLVANGTIDFDIPKQGILRRAVLDCIFKKSADSETQCPTGFLFAFESIEILSSGRRISLLTTEGIMAKISDMPFQVKQAYRNSLNMGPTALTAGGTQDYRVILPLDFFFTDNSKYSLITNFVEPLRVRVKFSDLLFQVDNSVTTNHAPTITQCNLQLEYRELPNPYTDSLIEQNYGDGMLTQLIGQSTYETSKNFTMTSTTTEENVIEIDLKENGAVKAMYIMVYVPHSQQPATRTTATQINLNKPLPIKTVKLEAGGQTIMEVSGEYLQYWGRTENGKDRYYASGGSLSSGGDNADNGHLIYKIDFGMGREDTSNVISFRELSNKKLTVTMLRELNSATGFGHGLSTLRGTTAKCQVVYETAQLMTTQSSSGRINLSLSN
tara:strand:+ start:2064 stop:3368 length:1305 start_codon:yes stop_codon:yes gene_type:complete